MKSTVINKANRMPFISMLLTAAAVMIHYFHFLRPHLLYTRTSLSGGDFWRMVSCHWVHLNPDHLLWSGATFLILGSVCEVMDRKKYILAMGVSAVAIPIAIWFAMPDLINYGGLSGLDCSLYSLLAVMLIKRDWQSRKWIWVIFYAILLGLLLAKIAYETATGLTIFVDISHTDMIPVPLSHLVGGLVGMAAGASTSGIKRKILGAESGINDRSSRLHTV
jgi:rhomboid family GlyGly-CTERM serine protease